MIRKFYKSFLFSLILFNATQMVAEEGYPPLHVLLSTTSSVLEQAIEYPEGQAQITAAIVTMQPGEKQVYINTMCHFLLI